MKNRKLLALVLAGALSLSLAACGGGSSSATPTPAPAESQAAEPAPTESQAAEPAAETYKVGVCQLLPHTALDAATQGFIDQLKEEFGDAVEIDDQNAGGEVPNCSTIVDGFIASGVDLILANATPSLTAAASATDTIPILGTAITNYGVALSLDTTEDKVLGGNISGTSDLAPLDQQAQMLHDLFPDAETVGLLYCSAEANSLFQVENVQSYLEGMGYSCKAFAFNDVNDLASVTQTACDWADVIYIPTDNTAADNTETIANIVIPAGVPVVAGEEGICKGCGCVTLSISYYELGQITGQMAAKILRGEESVSDMAIQYDTTLDKKYNAANCEALGVTVPSDYIAIE